MTRDELETIVRSIIPEEMYKKPGAVLYSGINTIKPFPFYLMGFNPGGSPSMSDNSKSIIDSLAPPDGSSAYTDECWPHNRYQRGVIQLARALGIPPAELPSSNAIFARSSCVKVLKVETGFDAATWWKYCWPVHQHLLAIVRPKIIITVGYNTSKDGSAFRLLADNAGEGGGPLGDAKCTSAWTFRGQLSLTSNDAIKVQVIGIKHLSYELPTEALLEELKTLAKV